MATSALIEASTTLPGNRREQLEPGCAHGSEACAQSGGERPTLENRISRVWEGLLAAGLAECPVCGGELRLIAGAGQCARCESVLA